MLDSNSIDRDSKISSPVNSFNEWDHLEEDY